MNTSQNIQKDFEEHAIIWGEALRKGEHRMANRQNRVVTKIAQNFKNDRRLGELVLMDLFRHPNPSVQLLSSVHALDLGIHIQKAEEVLTKVAANPNIHVIQLMAQINLAKWKEKKNNLSPT